MTYRSPEHQKFSVLVSSANTALEYVELACTLRSMKYREELHLAAPAKFPQDRPLTVRLTQSLRDDVLEFAAERCEKIAAAMVQDLMPDINIKSCCKV
jgi:hypothetical protein